MQNCPWPEAHRLKPKLKVMKAQISPKPYTLQREISRNLGPGSAPLSTIEEEPWLCRLWNEMALVRLSSVGKQGVDIICCCYNNILIYYSYCHIQCRRWHGLVRHKAAQRKKEAMIAPTPMLKSPKAVLGGTRIHRNHEPPIT